MGLRGWSAPRNNCGPTTIGGPCSHVVVRHQASRAGCDSRKGQLGDALMTKGVLRSAYGVNHRRSFANLLGHQYSC